MYHLNFYEVIYMWSTPFKDTPRENTPSNKTEAPMKIMNKYIWAIVILNQLYEVLILKLKFQKNEVVSGKSPYFVIRPFCTPHSICLNIGFW